MIPLAEQVSGAQLWFKRKEMFKLPYGIGVLHGLHYLKSLRDRLLHSDPSYYHSFTKTDEAVYCLSYLNQAVLCVGDDTLEFSWTKMDVEGGLLRG
ncbi:hypothetical protein K432DRAFT_377644 [Lepidopterella palustris CBS 459.81]|uniref:Uncharacterized protein n=1 Tax=Lepidopterella palustris CBS 459.81 TaxID=1314670 RepID=A0A8E2EK01_9PEZI|nr:hypothetical protein K432DRAFT_377644 [Lepidopterella palustris CBS 459.81]